MKLYGIGTDIIKVDRIKKLIKKSNLKKRLFNLNEIKKCEKTKNTSNCFAKRFAAKEAVMKSLGKGWRDLKWTEIEITGGGKPTVNLYGNASQLAETNKVGTIHVSLSHEKETAIAFVISEVA